MLFRWSAKRCGRCVRSHIYGRIFLHLVMVQAILLPLYGAWFDQDFAGRQPGHGHIYLGEVDLGHAHGGHKHGGHKHGDDGHDHQHADSPYRGSTSCVEDEIIFLPSGETWGQTWAFVLPLSLLCAWGSNTPSFPLVHTPLAQQLLFISPLDKPPQT